MPTIWKETIKPVAVQEVMLPKGAEILCAREQWEQPCIWFRCDPMAQKEPRKIAICGTGHAAPEGGESRYLGTALLQRGALVLHVFEQI